jgi:hypothetical protein
MITNNKQSKISAGFCQPQWLIKWRKVPWTANFYPVTFGITCYFLLTFLPENILTLFPKLEIFTDFMSRVVPAISAFSNNVPQESVRFIYALSWAMLPLWIPIYRLKEIFLVTNEKGLKNLKEGIDAGIIGGFKYKLIGLMMPAVSILVLWVTWSGEVFIGGAPAIAKSFTFTNNFFIALWTFVFTQGFLAGIWLTIISIRFYPVIIKFIFSKDYK